MTDSSLSKKWLIGNHHSKIHGHCTGGKVSSEWLAWKNMQDRCYNKKNDSYKNYGARGITVCIKWREGFQNFYDDMGDKPSPLHSLERKNVNGNYEPTNCRWATFKEQCRNKRTNKLITYENITMTLQEWAEKLGMDKRTLLWRFRAGWSVGDSLTKPIDKTTKGTK